MATQMIIRIEPELKEKAGRLAQTEGKNLSELVRQLIEKYIKERDIEEYIDGLWNRIGDKLKTKGVDAKDIEEVIIQVRAEK